MNKMFPRIAFSVPIQGQGTVTFQPGDKILPSDISATEFANIAATLPVDLVPIGDPDPPFVASMQRLRLRGYGNVDVPAMLAQLGYLGETMPQVQDIKWGKYRDWEGPYYPGSVTYTLPDNPLWQEKVLQVVTSTEGGRFDAINMYDRCIISAGLVQECEGSIFRLSAMLGALVQGTGTQEILIPILTLAEESGFSFRYVQTQSHGYQWRFCNIKTEKPMDSVTTQQAFFLGCKGTIGSWGQPDSPQRAHAKQWAVAVATVFAEPVAQLIQSRRVASRIADFYTMQASTILLNDNRGRVAGGVLADASIAAYTSFAANLPAVASKWLEFTVKNSKHPKFSQGWLNDLLANLTLKPGIAIYAERYNKIRPVIERLYGVDLPDFAKDLIPLVERAQGESNGKAYDLSTVKGLQDALVALKFDLGPKGNDGILGPKTKAAIMAFQTMHGLTVDGIAGPRTVNALKQALADIE